MDPPIDVEWARRRLGGDRNGNEVLCSGPGHSKGDRSLAVRFGAFPEGFLVHSHAGDNPLACRDHVRLALGLERRWGTSRKPRPVIVRAREPDPVVNERAYLARDIWNETRDLLRTPGEVYLLSRGIKPTPDIREVVRYHPALRFEGGTTPGLVAPFHDIVTDELCGIHRTFLDGAGRKIDRKMLGRAKDAAIKLDPDADVTMGLHIGEGIETVLTGRGMGYRPAWALGSAGAIAKFPVLAGIEALTVFAEDDKSGANQRAIEEVMKRYLAAGCEVFTLRPKQGGDLNDIADRRGTA